MKPCWVVGTGLWSDGYADVQSWLDGATSDEVTTPTSSLLSRRHLRYTSTVTRMTVCAFAQATDASSTDVSKVGLVMASSLGEIQIAVKLLDQLAADGAPSPAYFMNSVHNSGPGHIGIGCRNHGGATALAAGPNIVSAALTEAMVLLDAGEYQSVAVICADEAPPADLERRYPSLGVCLIIDSEQSARALAKLQNLRLSPDLSAANPGFSGNPAAPAAALLQAVHQQSPATLRLDGPAGDGWAIDVEPTVHT